MERMAEPTRTRKKTARCDCGSVELEALGTLAAVVEARRR
jgi:hypothetical protein